MGGRYVAGMRLIRYLAAGASGIVAMEIASYLDMLVRGRPGSDQPQQLGERLSERVHFAPGASEEAMARRNALGSVVGYVDGLALPLLVALVRPHRHSVLADAVVLTAGAMVGSSALPVALDVTDLRRWSRDDWLTDLVPHLAYGAVASTVSHFGR